MTQTGILSVHLEKPHEEHELVDVLCSLFGLQTEDLASLDTMTPETRVAYQVFQRRRGFRTALELYVGRAPQGVPRSDFDLAKALARLYGERVLIPPRDSDPNPNVWDLVTADDTPRRVHGMVESDEAIVLDEDTLGAR